MEDSAKWEGNQNNFLMEKLLQAPGIRTSNILVLKWADATGWAIVITECQDYNIELKALC